MRTSFARKIVVSLAAAASLAVASPVAAHAASPTRQPDASAGYEASKTISPNGILVLMEVWSGDCRLTLSLIEDGPNAGTYYLEKMCVTFEGTYL